MTDIRTGTGCRENYFDDNDAYDGERDRSKGTNLAVQRWRGPLLPPGEQADLLRAARTGDEAAKTKLIQSFHRTVLKIAGEYYGPSFDDRIAAGLEGLWEAIAHFDLERNNQLAAFAKDRIRNKIRKLVKDWRRSGQAGETRADRYSYDNPNATAEEVAAKVGCSVRAAEAAIDRQRLDRPARYDTTEGYPVDEDGNVQSPRLVTSHEMYGEYGCFSRFQLSPQLRLHEAQSKRIDALAVNEDRRLRRRSPKGKRKCQPHHTKNPSIRR